MIEMCARGFTVLTTVNVVSSHLILILMSLWLDDASRFGEYAVNDVKAGELRHACKLSSTVAFQCTCTRKGTQFRCANTPAEGQSIPPKVYAELVHKGYILNISRWMQWLSGPYTVRVQFLEMIVQALFVAFIIGLYQSLE